MTKADKKKIKKLTSKQVRYLRGLGHHLTPKVMIGKEGITDSLLSSLEAVLLTYELIKIKIQSGSEVGRQEVAEILSKMTGALIVQILGKTILLYRENEKLKSDKKIQLPKNNSAGSKIL